MCRNAKRIEPVIRNHAADQLLTWCTSVIGPHEIISGKQRPDGRSSVSRLQTATGHCYLKVHEQEDVWEHEVHGYEQWAPVFGDFAPRMLGVHGHPPLALLVAELPGQALEKRGLSVGQERAAWRKAGQMLARLHDLPGGRYFGPCRRDGSPRGPAISDAVEYVHLEFEREIAKAVDGGYLDDQELSVVASAQQSAGVFTGEQPVACHRDYCPYNWLVTEQGAWSGVIDFEFACWDVRVADFSRYPDWEWMNRSDLLDAFFEGYGRVLTPQEEAQRLVAYAQYALSAITWGMEASYFGFAEEGRAALKRLAPMVG
jgi:8-oxo-dGTP diphosphatase